MAPGASLRKVRQPALHNISQLVKTSTRSLSSLIYSSFFYRNFSCSTLSNAKYTVHYLVLYRFIYPLCTGVLSGLSHFQWSCFIKSKMYVLLGKTSTKHDLVWRTMYRLRSSVMLYCIHVGLCISESTISYPILNDVLFTPVFKQFLCPGMLKCIKFGLSSHNMHDRKGKRRLLSRDRTNKQTNVCLFDISVTVHHIYK